MAVFYFNLYDDLETIDEEGQDFPDLDAATAYGLKEMRLMASELVKEGTLNLHHRLEIAEGNSRVLQTIRVGDVVQVVS